MSLIDKKLPVAPGIATRNPGIATRNKKLPISEKDQGEATCKVLGSTKSFTARLGPTNGKPSRELKAISCQQMSWSAAWPTCILICKDSKNLFGASKGSKRELNKDKKIEAQKANLGILRAPQDAWLETSRIGEAKVVEPLCWLATTKPSSSDDPSRDRRVGG